MIQREKVLKSNLEDLGIIVLPRKGMPDFLVFTKHGIWFAIEEKKIGADLSVEQVETRHKLERGFPYFVLNGNSTLPEDIVWLSQADPKEESFFNDVFEKLKTRKTLIDKLRSEKNEFNEQIRRNRGLEGKIKSYGYLGSLRINTKGEDKWLVLATRSLAFAHGIFKLLKEPWSCTEYRLGFSGTPRPEREGLEEFRRHPARSRLIDDIRRKRRFQNILEGLQKTKSLKELEEMNFKFDDALSHYTDSIINLTLDIIKEDYAFNTIIGNSDVHLLRAEKRIRFRHDGESIKIKHLAFLRDTKFYPFEEPLTESVPNVRNRPEWRKSL